MQTPESNGQTDYIYFPIQYTTRALSVVLTLNLEGVGDHCVFAIIIDKTKFIDGASWDYEKGNNKNVFNVISVGF